MDLNNIFNYLSIFNANSENWEKFVELNVKQAGMFPKQIIDLFEMMINYDFKIINIEQFECNENTEKLSKSLRKNGSDKTHKHNYYILYSYIFDKLNKINPRILEIGIGTNNTQLISHMGKRGIPGASLRAWSEYFPNGEIFGADVDKNILFQENNIRTTFVDQLDSSTFNQLYESFNSKQFDVIIDDGLHSIGANFNTLINTLDKINTNGYLIIEDINKCEDSYKLWKIIDFMISHKKIYETMFINSKRAYMYVIHKIK